MKTSIAPRGGPISPQPGITGNARPRNSRLIAVRFSAGLRLWRHLVFGWTVCAAGFIPVAALAQSTPPETSPASATTSSRASARLQSDAIESIKTLLAGKRTSEALQVAEKALRQFPANVQMRFLHGVALTDAGNTEEAIEAFTQLSQEHPELAEPYNNLAVLYASSGNLLGARDALEKAVIAVPDYPLAYENLGDVYVRLAVQSYEAGIDRDNASQAARRKLGLARTLLQQITP